MKRFEGLSPLNQDQNLVMTVSNIPNLTAVENPPVPTSVQKLSVIKLTPVLKLTAPGGGRSGRPATEA